MFLFIEKVIKGGERLFELKKDELMIDFNIKDVVFLRLLQFEMIKQSLQLKEFSLFVKQDVFNELNVFIEEDDEKVIIYLDSNLDEFINGSFKVIFL